MGNKRSGKKRNEINVMRSLRSRTHLNKCRGLCLGTDEGLSWLVDRTDQWRLAQDQHSFVYTRNYRMIWHCNTRCRYLNPNLLNRLWIGIKNILWARMFRVLLTPRCLWVNIYTYKYIYIYKYESHIKSKTTDWSNRGNHTSQAFINILWSQLFWWKTSDDLKLWVKLLATSFI